MLYYVFVDRCLFWFVNKERIASFFCVSVLVCCFVLDVFLFFCACLFVFLCERGTNWLFFVCD